MPEAKGPDRLKYSVSAYRVMYILLLLVQQHSLSLSELNLALMNNPLINRAYNSETLSKYINTLRQLGCRIPRATHRDHFQYNLLNNAFPLPVEDTEIHGARSALDLLASQPDEDLHVAYQRLLDKMAWSLGDENRKRLSPDGESTRTVSLRSDADSQRQQLVQRYKEFCRDVQVLEVFYRCANEREGITVEPARVVQERSGAFLIGYDWKTGRKVRLNLEEIRHVRQLPLKNQHKMRLISVVFHLTGRLAKTYRPYPGEGVVSWEATQLKVRAKTDDPSHLLNRLMKYGASCEVLSPAYLRQEALERIQTLLRSQFDQPTEIVVPPVALDDLAVVRRG